MYLPLWDYPFMEMAPLMEMKTSSWGDDSIGVQRPHWWGRFLHEIHALLVLGLGKELPLCLTFLCCCWMLEIHHLACDLRDTWWILSNLCYLLYFLVNFPRVLRESTLNPPPIHEDPTNKSLTLNHSPSAYLSNDKIKHTFQRRAKQNSRNIRWTNFAYFFHVDCLEFSNNIDSMNFYKI